MFVVSGILALSGGWFYPLLFFAQLMFYLGSFLGYMFETKNIRMKLLYVPFYFCMMNWAVIAGLKRYMKGQQSALWEKAGRKGIVT
jgi:poly-beta-1,6-N-acetyl-D-glucosamine synthase